MKFYSGFSLKEEEYLFSQYIKKSDFTVCGFSYGAIAALKATLELLENAKRVDTLQLFSPAFFETKDAKFKRLQMRAYKSNKELYMKQFINACFKPYNVKITKHKETTQDELIELLEYVWNNESFALLQSKGVKIEVYLGGKDAIIDVESAREFFLQVGTVTYLKDANHFLQFN
jgi:pimeloyl-ACP methyl ester carboxylesterase